MNHAILSLTVALTLSTSAVAATDPAVDKVLRQLDAASLTFRSAEADLKVDLFEKVVRETTTQTGSIYFQRGKGGTEMAAVFTTPSRKYIHFGGGKGDMYDQVSNKTTNFNAGQDKARAESFLTLGFGGSGKDLERAWSIKLVGNETIGGTATTELDLSPKDPTVAQTFTHILVWFDPVRSVSLKQVYFTPEGDTRTTYYTNIRYNAPVDTRKYATPKH